MRSSNTRLRLVASVALVAAIATSCSSGSSGGAASTTTRPSRSAEQDSVSKGWGLEFHVNVYNATTKPVEVSWIAHPGSQGEISVSAGTGSGASQVVPAATVAPGKPMERGHLDMYVQMKDIRPDNTDKRDPVGPNDSEEDLLLVFPTFQQRVKLLHHWTSNGDCTNVPGAGNWCFFHRNDTVQTQVRQRDGFQIGLASAFSCLDPTQVTGDVGDTSKAWNAFTPAQFNDLEVEYRSAEAMKAVRDCYGPKRTLTRFTLPGGSLSTGGSSPTGPDLSHTKFVDAQLPGADLRGVNLTDVLFQGSPANLAYADLSGATLYGVDLSNADLTGAKFDGAKVDGGTKLNSALLPFVDLSKVVGTLRSDNVADVGQCYTTFGDVADDDPGTTTTTSPPGTAPFVTGPQGLCSVPFPPVLPANPGAVLPMTNDPTPLILIGGDGDFDSCPRPSSVGVHQGVAAPPGGCTTIMGSRQLAGGVGSIQVDAGTGTANKGAGTLTYTSDVTASFLGYSCPSSVAVGGACPTTIKPYR